MPILSRISFRSIRATLRGKTGRPRHRNSVFPSEPCFGEFIREKRRGPIKTFLFPLVALTFCSAMVTSTVQSSRG
jgi:hypothetical protein